MYWFVETCVIQVTLNAIKTFDKSFETSLGAAVKFLLRAFGIYSSTHAFMWNVLVKIHLQPAVLCCTKINTQIVINLWLNLYLCAVINVLVSILICVCLLLVSFSIPFSPEKPQHQVENIFQCFFYDFISILFVGLHFSRFLYVWINVNFWLIQTGDLAFTICFSIPIPLSYRFI